MVATVSKNTLNGVVTGEPDYDEGCDSYMRQKKGAGGWDQ